jgi:hypothetical protein
MQTPQRIRLPLTEQRARIDWRSRSFTLSYWSDAAAEKEMMIGGLMDFLLPQKYFVVPDTGWSGWDLKIARGLWNRALVTVCSENHGGPRRLLRVRCTMRLSRFAKFLLRFYAAATASALILGWPVVAAAVGGFGCVNFAMMGCRLLLFGRLMHRVIEAVARHLPLAPVSPVARAALPIGTARAV